MKSTVLKMLLLAALLACACVAVFGQMLHHEFLIYDDNLFVTDNRHIQSDLNAESVRWAFTNTYAYNWIPVTWLSYLLDYQLSGLDPWGYYLTNLVLHMLGTLSLFFALRSMTFATASSFFTAALFAVHPLHVESVAWIAERRDVLSALFWFLAMGTYGWYAKRPRLDRYLAVTLFFALGLMSKPMLVTLPLILLVLDYWPLGRTGDGALRKWAPLLLEKIPLLALSVAVGITTLLAQRGKGMAGLESISLGARVLNAVVAYAAYLWKMVWPANLAVLYPYHSASRHFIPAALSLFLIAAITLICVRTRKRHPFLLAGWLWYVVTLLPVIGLVQVGGQSQADRYTYIPLVGIFIMISWLAPLLAERVPAGRRILPVAASLIIAALMAASWFQTRTWRSSEALMRQALAATRDNDVAHVNLGIVLLDQGRISQAIEHFQEALKINPDRPNTHYSLGEAYFHQKRYAEAAASFRETIRLSPADADAYANLGASLMNAGRYAEAAKATAEALKIAPGHPVARRNLPFVRYYLKGNRP